MSSTKWEFAVGDRPEIVVSVFSADVGVVEGSDGTVTVEIDGPDRERDLFEILHTGDTVSVRSRKGGRRWMRQRANVQLTVPASTSVRARTASGDLNLTVPVSDVEIDVASGDVHLTSVSGRGRIRAASGDITIGAAAGAVRISSASGDVRIDDVEGDASISTASGDVRLGTTQGSVEIRTASGDVAIRRFSGVMLEGSAMSGDFVVGLVPGMAIEADIHTRSGTFRNLVSAGKGERTINTTMRLKTMSGDITLR